MSKKRANIFFNYITVLLSLVLIAVAFYFFVFRTDAVRPPCKITTPFSCDEVGFKVVNNSVKAILLNLTYGAGGYGGIVYSIRPVGGELALFGCSFNETRNVDVLSRQQYELKCRYPLLPDRIDSEFFVEYDKLDISQMPLGIRHSAKGSLRIVDIVVVLKRANQTNALNLNT